MTEFQTPNGWQPITTAPRDGTKILACDYGDVYVCHWFTTDHPELNTWAEGWLNNSVLRDEPLLKPTHWQPLPKPPHAKA